MSKDKIEAVISFSRLEASTMGQRLLHESRQEVVGDIIFPIHLATIKEEYKDTFEYPFYEMDFERMYEDSMKNGKMSRTIMDNTDPNNIKMSVETNEKNK